MTDFGQLEKMPHLLAHYQEHKQQMKAGGNLSFLEFFT